MNGRNDAGFSGRVWEEIDRTTAAVKAANCTARRFLEVDGPYGEGLTSVAAADLRAALAPPFGGPPPAIAGTPPAQWGVAPAPGLVPGPAPLIFGGGTYVAAGGTRPVPVIASQFTLGTRAITAYETQCQPLDLAPALAAARDVALEEERLIYYGSAADPIGLLTVWAWLAVVLGVVVAETNVTFTYGLDLFDAIHDAVLALETRGYAGPFALVVSPDTYRQLYSPVLVIGGNPVTAPATLVDLIRNLFRGGIYMAPVIQPDGGDVRVGAVVTLGRAYSRLVVGQDWYADYRGRDGILHNFVLLSSLQFQSSAPAALPSIQVIMQPGVVAGAPPPVLGGFVVNHP